MSENTEKRKVGLGHIKQLGAKRPLVFGEMNFDPEQNIWKGNDSVLAIFQHSQLNLITKKDYQKLPEKMKMCTITKDSEECNDMVYDEKSNQWKGNEEILLEFEVSDGELQVSPVITREIPKMNTSSSGIIGSPSQLITKVRVRKPNLSTEENSKSLLDRFKESLGEDDQWFEVMTPEEAPPKPSTRPESDDEWADIQIPKENNWHISQFKLVQQDEENWYFQLNEEGNNNVEKEEWSDVEVPTNGILELKSKEWKDSNEEEPWNDVDVDISKIKKKKT